MSALKFVEVVKHIVHLSLELNSSPDDPEIIFQLKKKGFGDDDIQEALKKVMVPEVKPNFRKDNMQRPLRTMNEIERQYLSREVQQFIHQLYQSGVLNCQQVEDIINYLVAIANKPLTMEDVHILLKEYFVENNHYDAFWLFFFDDFTGSHDANSVMIH
jgi:uncharacterized protein Smg (DUF494 family)